MSKAEPGVKIEGFMSHKSKIYLADVHDHMEHVLASLDMFAGISENLINYTFNVIIRSFHVLVSNNDIVYVGGVIPDERVHVRGLDLSS
jgi:hypothetical protein